MTERADLFCGCAFIKVNADEKWWQVVACPLHIMAMKPLDEPKAVTS